MKRLAVALMLIASPASAQWKYDNSPNREFDVSKNIASSVTITWRYVEANRVTEECNKESFRVGNNGFKGDVDACTFTWANQRRCTIITARHVSMRTIGHEVMHCFQGNWHPD